MLLRRHIKDYKLEARLFQRRLFFAMIIVAIFIGILLLRLVYLQIFAYKHYDQLATQNQLEMFAIEPNRGLIYDRNGVLLAENTPIFTLTIIPDYVSNIQHTIAEVAKVVELSDSHIAQFYKTLKQHKKFAHVPLKYKLTQDEVERFYANQFRFPEVAIDAIMIRHYTLGEATAGVIGYIGKINVQDSKNIDANSYTLNSLMGKIGIEKYYEDVLRGKIGHQQVEIDASGHIVRKLDTINPEPGNNLYLTIDSKLQVAAQRALGNERGAVVAIDPNNGEILALVTNPSYDPNLFAYGIDSDTFSALQKSPDKPMYNRAVRGLFPIASTIKPFIALTALDTNTIDTNFTIFDPGWFKLPNSKHIFRDWLSSGHGRVNVSKAITESSDVFFYTLSTKLGIDKIGMSLARFGFGQKTGIDLAEELTGIIASPKWKLANVKKPWYPGDTVNSSIGQGFMLTTPLQLAHAVTALANRGIRYRPHLLLKKQDADGVFTEQAPQQLIPINLKNKLNWDVVINAMKNVTLSPTGTAYRHFGAKLPYTVAGKTGTAQLFRHRFNEESATFETANIAKKLRNHSLFIAFAPVERPQIALAVIVENSVIAPAVARKILDYYFLPADARDANDSKEEGGIEKSERQKTKKTDEEISTDEAEKANGEEIDEVMEKIAIEKVEEAENVSAASAGVEQPEMAPLSSG